MAALVALPLGAAPAGASSALLQLRFGTREHPFEGGRYETMRALARNLDERAQNAAAQAIDDSHHGTHDEKKFLDSVTHFADKSRDFRTRMDRYREDPWDVADEVEHLNDDATKVSERIRAAHVFESTWDDWDAVLDVLSSMNRTIAGHDLEVPMPARPSRDDHQRDYEPGAPERIERSASILSGRERTEFRRLALELDDNATRARRAAENGVAASARGREVIRDIESFNERTHDLAARSDNGELRTREIGPTVDSLLEDARRTEESLRSARVFPEVWETWTRTIHTLERMEDLVR